MQLFRTHGPSPSGSAVGYRTTETSALPASGLEASPIMVGLLEGTWASGFVSLGLDPSCVLYFLVCVWREDPSPLPRPHLHASGSPFSQWAQWGTQPQPVGLRRPCYSAQLMVGTRWCWDEGRGRQPWLSLGSDSAGCGGERVWKRPSIPPRVARGEHGGPQDHGAQPGAGAAGRGWGPATGTSLAARHAGLCFSRRRGFCEHEGSSVRPSGGRSHRWPSNRTRAGATRGG